MNSQNMSGGKQMNHPGFGDHTSGSAMAGLPKTNFENYYERKLHEEREGHNAVANKLLMGAIGTKLKETMHDANARNGGNAKTNHNMNNYNGDMHQQ
jgi:hypothetical protein